MLHANSVVLHEMPGGEGGTWRRQIPLEELEALRPSSNLAAAWLDSLRAAALPDETPPANPRDETLPPRSGGLRRATGYVACWPRSCSVL